MARVYLGLGSNVEPVENLRLGVGELRRRYGVIDLSPVYRSAALGFKGDDFLNLVAAMSTRDSPQAIHAQIEQIHDRSGRVRGSKRFASRPLDIDILLYGDRILTTPRFDIPRADVLDYSFVLRPLADLAPSLVHPETGRTMAEHWAEFDAERHPVTRVNVIL
ncbi:MAG: 2-amino-4-hydroxy-6-hydroxymethyldihydropteridine diphosphokinase [Woeseiaceae bacterium]|nr:2-amino-4-hydroxy-6-hydroxymethyldihydropteridine diphosphokinase [Woeseiaceae bacterium]